MTDARRSAPAVARNRDPILAVLRRVLPARGQAVTVYRHTADARVITGRTVVRPDGTYRFDRRFTGSGEFGFSVATGATDRNLAGQSRVRRTVIH